MKVTSFKYITKTNVHFKVNEHVDKFHTIVFRLRKREDLCLLSSEALKNWKR